jgi:hypothetical protein
MPGHLYRATQLVGAMPMRPKALEPRGAFTPGVPELWLKLGSEDLRGHRGMGNPQAIANRRALSRGDWGSRPGCLTTQPYDPCVVTFHCTTVYVCRPIAAKIAMRPTQAGRRPRKPKPHTSGALNRDHTVRCRENSIAAVICSHQNLK